MQYTVEVKQVQPVSETIFNTLLDILDDTSKIVVSGVFTVNTNESITELKNRFRIWFNTNLAKKNDIAGKTIAIFNKLNGYTFEVN